MPLLSRCQGENLRRERRTEEPHKHLLLQAELSCLKALRAGAPPTEDRHTGQRGRKPLLCVGCGWQEMNFSNLDVNQARVCNVTDISGKSGVNGHRGSELQVSSVVEIPRVQLRSFMTESTRTSRLQSSAMSACLQSNVGGGGVSDIGGA